MPLEKSRLAANGNAMPKKRKNVIQPAFDLEYSSVIEHTIYVTDSPQARRVVTRFDYRTLLNASFDTYS